MALHRRARLFSLAVAVAAALAALLVAGPAAALSPDGKALLSLLPGAAPSPVLPSWDPRAATPCSWQGVTCSPQSRVVSLSLPNTFLNLSALPPPLAALSSLQLLNLSTCNISGAIPPSYASLSALRVLDLSSNALTGDIPGELGALSGLQFLLLNSNRLTGGIPRSLRRTSLLLPPLRQATAQGKGREQGRRGGRSGRGEQSPRPADPRRQSSRPPWASVARAPGGQRGEGRRGRRRPRLRRGWGGAEEGSAATAARLARGLVYLRGER